MRRYFRLFAILCAFAFLLTACGGAGEEIEPDPQEESETLWESEAQEESETPLESDAQEESETPPQSEPQEELETPSEPDAQAPPESAPLSQVTSDTEERTVDELQTIPDAQAVEIPPEVPNMLDAIPVSQFAYPVNPDSCTVYLTENQTYVPFLVVDADADTVLLLRRDLLPDSRPFNSYGAYYDDSAIDRYLNGDYAQSLGGVADLMAPSEIAITDADALGVSGNAVTTITRKIYLLSCAEIGETELVNAAPEGQALSYFSDGANRIARRGDGGAGSWWLRTPDAYYLSMVYGVGADGTIGSGNAYDENGVRPAFRIPSDALTFPSDAIVSGQTVRFLAP